MWTWPACRPRRSASPGLTVAGTLVVAVLALLIGKPVLAVFALVAPVVVYLVVSSRANRVAP